MIYDSENDDYEYDYHDLIEDTDFIDDEAYYDDGTDEPWMNGDVVLDEQDQYEDYMNKYDAYYHDIADELDD